MRITLLLIIYLFFCTSCNESKEVKKNNTIACTSGFFDRITGKYVYRSVEVMPSFPDSEKDIHEYIEEKLEYVEVLDNDLKFTILLQFIVDVDGSIIGERVFFRSKTPQKGRTQELRNKELQYLQVIRDMPNWSIGKCGEEPVPVILSLPLRIKIRE